MMLEMTNGIQRLQQATYQNSDEDSALEQLGRMIDHHITC
jgi:hypothetical protein